MPLRTVVVHHRMQRNSWCHGVNYGARQTRIGCFRPGVCGVTFGLLTVCASSQGLVELATASLQRQEDAPWDCEAVSAAPRR